MRATATADILSDISKRRANASTTGSGDGGCDGCGEGIRPVEAGVEC